MGEDVEGTVGDEEAGYVEHAGVDSGVEAEGAWEGVEEVAEWEGEVGGSVLSGDGIVELCVWRGAWIFGVWDAGICRLYDMRRMCSRYAMRALYMRHLAAYSMHIRLQSMTKR